MINKLGMSGIIKKDYYILKKKGEQNKKYEKKNKNGVDNFKIVYYTKKTKKHGGLSKWS